MKGKSLLTALSGAFLLGACGGDATLPLLPSEIPDYTGLETEATITNTNAQRLIREMFGLAAALVEQTGEDTSAIKPEPYNLRFPLAVTASIEKLDTESLAPAVADFAGGTFRDTLNCDSGSIDYEITVDNLSGALTGFIDFKNCLISDLTLEGNSQVSGSYDLVSIRLAQISLDFPALVGEADDSSYLAAGSMGIEFDLSTRTSLIDYAVIIDGRQSIKFEAFTLDVIEDPDRTLTLAGRFYHPTEGFVTVSTEQPLFFTADIVWPYQGQTGMTGLESSLKIETGDTRSFTLWLDLDGDGEDDQVSLEEW